MAEVNRCKRKERWGPCLLGATSSATLLSGGHQTSLLTNGQHDVLLLHLFQSKARWRAVPDVSEWSCINVTNLIGGSQTADDTIRVRQC